MKVSKKFAALIVLSIFLIGCQPKRVVEISYFRNSSIPANADLVITVQFNTDTRLPSNLYAENIELVSNRDWNGLVASYYRNDSLVFQNGDATRFVFEKISANKNIYEIVIDQGLLHVDGWSMYNGCPFRQVVIHSPFVDGQLWDMDFELPGTISADFPCDLTAFDSPGFNADMQEDPTPFEVPDGSMAIYNADYSTQDRTWVVTGKANDFISCDELNDLQDQPDWNLTSETFFSIFDSRQYYVLEYADDSVPKSIADAFAQDEIDALCPDLIASGVPGFVEQQSYFDPDEPDADTGNEASSIKCPNALPTRVNIGMTIQVTTSGDVARLGIRPEPTLDASRMFQIDPGGQMYVLDGPECANDSYFWYVNTSLGKGWVREANDKFYFVDPVSSVAENIPPSTGGSSDYIGVLYEYYDAKNREDVEGEVSLLDWSGKSQSEMDEAKEYLVWYYETYDVQYKILSMPETKIYNAEVAYIHVKVEYQFAGRDPKVQDQVYEIRLRDGQWKIVGLAKLFKGQPDAPVLLSPENESVVRDNPFTLSWTNPHDESSAERVIFTIGFEIDSNDPSFRYFVVDVWAYDPTASDWVQIRNWVETDTEMQIWFDDSNSGLPTGYTAFAWQVQYVNVLYEQSESEWSEWYYFDTR